MIRRLLTALLALVTAAVLIAVAGHRDRPSSPGVSHPTHAPVGRHPISHAATVPAFHI